jgi:hypothetical protein
MAYLRCPNCGITLFDRNPLVPARRCPRCSARGGSAPTLEPVSHLRGGAAGSVFSAAGEEPDAADDAAPAP